MSTNHSVIVRTSNRRSRGQFFGLRPFVSMIGHCIEGDDENVETTLFLQSRLPSRNVSTVDITLPIHPDIVGWAVACALQCPGRILNLGEDNLDNLRKAYEMAHSDTMQSDQALASAVMDRLFCGHVPAFDTVPANRPVRARRPGNGARDDDPTVRDDCRTVRDREPTRVDPRTGDQISANGLWYL